MFFSFNATATTEIYTLSLHDALPISPQRESNPLDGLLAKAAHTMFNRGMLEAFGTGRWKFLLPPATTIRGRRDRKSTRLNSSHGYISYAVFCLKKKKRTTNSRHQSKL